MHQIATFFSQENTPPNNFRRLMHSATPKIIKRFLVFKYQKKELRISMYAEYIDDVKNCLKFDCPFAFINKGVLQQNMFSVFLISGQSHAWADVLCLIHSSGQLTKVHCVNQHNVVLWQDHVVTSFVDRGTFEIQQQDHNIIYIAAGS